MSWIETRCRNGRIVYFVRDIRDGRQVSISTPEGVDRGYVERLKELYDSHLKEIKNKGGNGHGVD